MERALLKHLMMRGMFRRAASTQQKNTTFAPLLWTSERTRIIWTFIAVALLIVAASVVSKASELSGETLTAWDEYVRVQNAHVVASSHAGPFLWSDQAPDRIRRLRHGEVLVAPMGENPKPVPRGLIHHWIGAMFLAHTSLDDVLTVIRDYDRYKNFYAPNVIDSKLLHQADTEDAFSMRMLNKAVVAQFALDAEFQSSYSRLSQDRWYSVGYSTRVREVEAYGQPDQHEMPADTGHGFIWRIYNVSRFEQRDGGVYIELEAVALSRDVPSAFRWLVNPVVRRVSKGSVLVSLQKTQEAVLASNLLAGRVVLKDSQVEDRSASARKLSATRVDNALLRSNSFGPKHTSQ